MRTEFAATGAGVADMTEKQVEKLQSRLARMEEQVRGMRDRAYNRGDGEVEAVLEGLRGDLLDALDAFADLGDLRWQR